MFLKRNPQTLLKNNINCCIGNLGNLTQYQSKQQNNHEQRMSCQQNPININSNHINHQYRIATPKFHFINMSQNRQSLDKFQAGRQKYLDEKIRFLKSGFNGQKESYRQTSSYQYQQSSFNFNINKEFPQNNPNGNIINPFIKSQNSLNVTQNKRFLNNQRNSMKISTNSIPNNHYKKDAISLSSSLNLKKTLKLTHNSHNNINHVNSSRLSYNENYNYQNYTENSQNINQKFLAGKKGYKSYQISKNYTQESLLLQQDHFNHQYKQQKQIFKQVQQKSKSKSKQKSKSKIHLSKQNYNKIHIPKRNETIPFKKVKTVNMQQSQINQSVNLSKDLHRLSISDNLKNSFNRSYLYLQSQQQNKNQKYQSKYQNESLLNSSRNSSLRNHARSGKQLRFQDHRAVLSFQNNKQRIFKSNGNSREKLTSNEMMNLANRQQYQNQSNFSHNISHLNPQYPFFHQIFLHQHQNPSQAISFKPYINDEKTFFQHPNNQKPINIAAIKEKSLRQSNSKSSKKKNNNNIIIQSKEEQKKNSKNNSFSFQSRQIKNKNLNGLPFEYSIQTQKIGQSYPFQNKLARPPNLNHNTPNIKFSGAISTQVDMINSQRNPFDSIIPIKINKKYQSESADNSPNTNKNKKFFDRKITIISIDDQLSDQESILVDFGQNKQQNESTKFIKNVKEIIDLREMKDFKDNPFSTFKKINNFYY